MAKKNPSGKATNRTRDYHPLDDFIVPELEEESGIRQPWTPEEVAVLLKYYGKKPTVAIKRYLDKAFPPGRTIEAVYKKARALGISGRVD